MKGFQPLLSTYSPNLNRITLSKIRGIEKHCADDQQGLFLWTTLRLEPIYILGHKCTKALRKLAEQFTEKRFAQPPAIPLKRTTPLNSSVFIRIHLLGVQTPGKIIEHSRTRFNFYRPDGSREHFCLIQMRRARQWIPAEIVYLTVPGIHLDPLHHDFFLADHTPNKN